MKTSMTSFSPAGRLMAKVFNQANSSGIKQSNIPNGIASRRLAHSRASNKNSDGTLMFTTDRSEVDGDDVVID